MTMLPSDRYLCSLLGITEEELIEFHAAARRHLKENPIEGPVAGLDPITQAAILIAVGIGLQVASSLLKPSQPLQQRQPGQLPQPGQAGGEVVQTNASFAPRYGFDSVQAITKLNATVPLVYGKRTVSGTKTGGVRTNLPLLWSQTLSLGASQMLRAVFLVSEGEINGFDDDLWAIGSNLLKNYKFNRNSATQAASRATIYVSKDDGAIIESDRVFGRSGENDRRANGGGSSATSSSGQVFKVELGSGQTETAAFSAVHTPSSNTQFGVFSLIGNDLAYKVNPIIRSGVKVSQQSGALDERVEIQCPIDGAQIAKRSKYKFTYSGFSGIYKHGTSVATLAAITSNQTLTLQPGHAVAYVLLDESEKDIRFLSDGETETSKDVAASVASRQVQYDQNLIVGELYRIGTAQGVLVSRTSGVFRSEADEVGSTNQIEAVFEIVEGGTVQGYTEAHLKGSYTGSTVTNPSSSPDRAVATNNGHILRYAQAVVTNTRACDVTEIGIDSTLGGRITGLCNFKEARSHETADNLMCTPFTNTEAQDVESTIYQSGTLSVSFDRFSCFSVQYKELSTDADDDWINSGKVFAIHSETQQSVFNFLRFECATAKLRIFRIRPLSGFDIRSKSSGQIYILEPNGTYQYQSTASLGGDSVSVAFNGRIVSHPFHNDFRQKYNEGDPDLDANYSKVLVKNSSSTSFTSLSNVDTADGSGYDSYIDDYMSLAEAYIYPEVTCSAASGPEHRVAYVNEIVTGQTGDYDNLATVGINIRSSTEWRQFTQFSGYVKGGILARKLSDYTSLPFSPTLDNVFHFPDVLLDLMTNARYGLGEFIKDEMIDLDGFKESRQWCNQRGYYFNGVIAEQLNLRQYAADLAATHLLFFGEINGKFVLKPALPVDASTGSFVAADIKGLFTVGNILEGSYKCEYLPPEDREPIEVSVTYREERASTDATSEGAFAVVREVLVKEIDSSTSSPYVTTETVSLDMTDYCTQEDHAIDAAKYLIRMRRIPDHVVTFQTTHQAMLYAIQPGDYVNVALDASDFEEYKNGVVTDSGMLVTTESFTDGTHTVFMWDPTSGTDPASGTLTVSNGGTTASPTGIVFTEIVSNTNSRTYQVEKITSSPEGILTIEALHMPLNNTSGEPRVAHGFGTAANWSITTS